MTNRIQKGAITQPKHSLVNTPLDLINEMVGMLHAHKSDTIIDLCADRGQIIDAVKLKYPNNDLYALEYRDTIINLPKNKVLRQDVFDLNRKFDICITNSPWNNNLDLKVLHYLLTNNLINKQIVSVNFCNFILKNYSVKNKVENELKEILSTKLKSIRIFNGNPVFGINSFKHCAVFDIDLYKNTKDIDVDYFGDKFVVNDINDVTIYGSSYKIAQSIMNKVLTKCKAKNIRMLSDMDQRKRFHENFPELKK